VNGIELAQRHRLTLYDAAYFELSLRRGLPLATFDAALRRAANAANAALLQQARSVVVPRKART
jgi:predicted nucleic acid-binding protein